MDTITGKLKLKTGLFRPGLLEIVLILIILAVATFVAYRLWNRVTADTLQSNDIKAGLIAKVILEHEKASIGLLRSFAAQPSFVQAFKKRNMKETLRQFKNLVRNNSEIENIFVADQGGTLWFNYPIFTESWNKNFAYRDWYKGVSKEWKPYVSGIYKMIIGEQDLCISVCVPVFDEKEKVIGILSAYQATGFFQKVIHDIGADVDSKITVIDQEGQIIYSNRFPYKKEVIKYTAFPFVKKALAGEEGRAVIRDSSDGHQTKYISFAPVEGHGWSVIVEKARGDILASQYEGLITIAIISCLSGLVVLISGSYFRQRQIKISELAQVNQELDIRVKERTAALEASNEELKREIKHRQKAEEDLGKNEAEAKLLSSVAGRLLGTDNPQAIVNELCRDLMAHLDCHAFFNFLVDEAAGRLHLNACAGIPDEEAKKIEWLDYGIAVCGCVAQEGCRIIAEHIPTTPDVRTELVKSYGIKAYACHPLLGPGEKVIGTLSFGTRSRETFSDSDLSLMKAVTDQVAVAMERMRLIHDLQRSRDELKKEEERSRHLIKYAPSMIYEIDFYGPKFKSVNDVLCNTLGYTREELLAMNPLDLLVDESRKVFQDRIRRRLAGETISNSLEYKGRSKDGGEIWGLLNITFTEKDGKPEGAVVVAHDITERKRMEEDLRRSRGELELRVQERTAEIRKQAELIDLARDAIILTDADGTIRLWSKGAEEMYGWTKEEALGKITPELLHTEFSVPREEMMAELCRDGFLEAELTQARKNGTKLKVLSRWNLKRAAGQEDQIMVINSNITERLKLEEQLRQSQRMEALGTLAGGIAHDFNNLLMPILVNTEMALMDIKNGEIPSAELIETVMAGANRGKELVQQIITFSRHKGQELKPVDIAPITKETIKFLRSALPATVRFETRIEEPSPLVLGNPTHIHQILMNLCNNAAHSMQDRGGVLEISLERVDLNETAGMKAGGYVCLKVKDTGHGMSPEIREKAFDPFFTTKAMGKGTGLGLAVVHGLVKKHGGEVQLESELGKGTIVSVFLPVWDGILKEEAQSAVGGIPTGSETILLVDDEEVQTRTVGMMLKRLGYRVVAETDPRKALERFRSQPSDFDLVITDQVMPYLQGNLLAREMLTIRPDLRIILCTGFSESVDEKNKEAYGITEFIQKPFTAKEISHVIRRALEKRASSN